MKEAQLAGGVGVEQVGGADAEEDEAGGGAVPGGLAFALPAAELGPGGALDQGGGLGGAEQGALAGMDAPIGGADLHRHAAGDEILAGDAGGDFGGQAAEDVGDRAPVGGEDSFLE